MRALIFTLIMIFSLNSYADKSREFLLSATYGTLAGTLVGAATLAFADQPGDKLHRIARGASLGLYLGIALGIYVTSYYEPEEDKPEGDVYPEGQVPDDQARLYIAPTFTENRIDGASIQYEFAKF